MTTRRPDLRDHRQVAASLALDPGAVARLRTGWLALMELAVWAGPRARQVGAVPRLRKRLLALGEALASLAADRGWIPHPREQVKSALGAALRVREALADAARAAAGLEADATGERLRAELAALERTALALLERHEPLWAALLDSQLEAGDDEDGTGREA